MLILTKLDKDDSFKSIITCALRLYEDIDTPISLSCYILLKNKEYKQLVEKNILPSSYLSSWDYSLDNQAISFLAKYPNLDTGIDRNAVALRKFLMAEEQCRETNLSLDDRLNQEIDARVIFCYAREKIRSMLSSVKISFDDLRFGPGASSTCGGRFVTIPDKLQSKYELTFEARWLVAQIQNRFPWWDRSVRESDTPGYSSVKPTIVSIVDSNKLTFVPKNAKVDRAICIEPHLNITGQLMVGAAIRRALLREGIDLSKKASSNNIRLARQGSIDGTYATIDLSSASDTISLRLIEKLLPFDWYSLLYSLRSHKTTLPDGSVIINEKFSSMGNGFTFELESMIFYALSWAVRKYHRVAGEISVFGDDIICPTPMAKHLIRILEISGFTTNPDKTFIEGPFRESCGSDFFNGINVRAFYQKKDFVYETDKFKTLNGIRHYSTRLLNTCVGNDHYCGHFASSKLRKTWSYLHRTIPEKYRVYGPDSYGDQVIWSPRSQARPQYQYGMYCIKYVVPVLKMRGSKDLCLSAQVGSALYGAPSSVTLRGNIVGVKYKTARLSLWGENGSWL